MITARDAAEQSTRIKEQFLTNVSHEIRTPMNGILGFAKILEGTELDDDQKQSVNAIKRAGKNLIIVINDILDFSKIEADKVIFEEVDFSLSKNIKTVMELLSPIANDKKIKLILDIDNQISDLLIGDPMRLSQILINLIGNAIKFTEKGYVELIVSQIKESETDTSLEFTIIDTGVGISSDKFDSIFESFNQASNETTRKFGGTGLGLTIRRRLIELQRGSIKVESEIDKGSKFSFLIEYKKSKKSSIKIVKVKREKISPDFLKNIKILLVEDNELNQLLAKKVFEK